ncbi:hypothetical protein DA099_03050 [Photobacterium damselae]|uniref:Uncharacterized protein n=1 Tax=Photobacterium damselae TaxID=38293 RepID=A0ACD3SX87_PHODM|nr:hypothetical protein [Photobacterium damselae]RDL32835.1 hypothetical protein BC461_06410 [Photobacterium damselae]TMX54933.1 hypothetical protein DA099_03050 [Photobacterium damselae]TMX70048.1 hypothetical protein DA090_01950 [Photobacterium damselae]TMX74099.1 hypothetical protein DA092_12750 [Photobacterium damselae]
MRDEVKFIVATSWEPNIEEFLSSLGISVGGLGGQIFSSVYDALFKTSINVKEEYDRFYSVEYGSLSDYVEIRYGKSLSDEDLEAERIFAVTWLPQVVDDAYEENKLEVVMDSLARLNEAQNENKA